MRQQLKMKMNSGKTWITVEESGDDSFIVGEKKLSAEDFRKLQVLQDSNWIVIGHPESRRVPDPNSIQITFGKQH